MLFPAHICVAPCCFPVTPATLRVRTAHCMALKVTFCIVKSDNGTCLVETSYLTIRTCSPRGGLKLMYSMDISTHSPCTSGLASCTLALHSAPSQGLCISATQEVHTCLRGASLGSWTLLLPCFLHVLAPLSFSCPRPLSVKLRPSPQYLFPHPTPFFPILCHHLTF